ncbi:MAG: aspartate aminotransferase family protein, partial [Anaerolineales bacterium]|nr:aspartate aminotransferase family protein [Anaerolineales bacterium]
DHHHLHHLLEREEKTFRDEHPNSFELFSQARQSLFGGVPMSWMMKWAGRFPIFMREARGARVTDVDDKSYIDFCLGDTGAMPGHSPEATARAIAAQAARGITTMLPTEDAVWVGKELQRRFGLDFWQFTLTATDANRFVIRIAREITDRPKILVFNYCYHGTVDESLISLRDGVAGPRSGNVGMPVNPTATSKVVEFNDVDALRAALEPRDVACVLAEPAMTNIGIVLPEPGYHDALREITRETGTLLVIDETHTLCAGPGGYTRAHGLQPDILTVGKAIGGGMPAGAFGVTREVAERMYARKDADYVDVGGIGGTLAGNALSLAAIRATLENVLTEQNYAHMIPLATRWTEGVEEVIREYELPWHVTQLGCRTDFRFSANPSLTGGEANAAGDEELDRYMHLYALNRGILMTPFHNMALMSPETRASDVDYHSVVFGECVRELALQ